MSTSLLSIPIKQKEVDTATSIAYRTLGEGPPLLLLHGHPQTHMIWHKVAPVLAERFTLVLPDLRGYGRSSKPQGLEDHSNYSKRAMAQDLVTLMHRLGHERFAVCAHDRGARVTHRMLLDHPGCVSRAMLLDIAPTLAMYEQTSMDFARAYWHWFFLIQKAPLPERMIEADIEFYAKSVMISRHLAPTAFAPEAWQDYLECLRLPGAIHALCEDYRAAASIDLEHDRVSRDAGHKVQCPLHVLWGERGIIERCFDALTEWRKVAVNVSGQSLDCGHYIPEEAPQELLAHINAFFQPEMSV
jgi:haloacetate dehalogenase